jgi:uroporphyrinogen III methyltransferase/synthase
LRFVTREQSTDDGIVYLVGAGPGDPDLITLRGAACLSRADLVLYDYLVDPAVLRHVPASAELVCLGQAHRGRSMPQAEIDRRMIEAAGAGRTVVRLKCGDPGLFGRGAEETEALSAAGILFEVVPGVTAASAAFSHAGVPLTHRQAALAVALVTGHRADGTNSPEPEYERLGSFPGTLVFYMGTGSSHRWSASLVRGGRAPQTPVAVIRRATWPDQQVFYSTLGDVAELIQREQIRPPTLIVVGEAVAKRI